MFKIPSQKSINWFQRKLLKWGKSNYSEFPWRSCQSSIHQLLVEILLQRTRAEQVVPVFIKLLESYPTIDDLVKLTENQIRETIYPLGLHWRANFLYKLIQLIKNEFNGNIPDNFEDLKKLPSVGVYVASSYLSLHKGKRASIIDSNVVRIYARFHGFEYDGETRRKKWLIHLAEMLTPVRKFKEYNYALLDFGRIICKKKEMCTECPLISKCEYVQKF